jgi:hypothetical protein
MIKELKDIQHNAIYRGRNVRLPGNANEEELYQDIKINGLKQPMLVHGVGDLYEVIQGHLRSSSLDRLEQDEPARFVELFPNGTIQCMVLSDCTYEQAQLEKLDHGQENPLTSPMEVQLSMNFLFDAGLKEIEIAVQIAGLMNRVSPMKATTRREIEQLQRDVEMYTKEGRFVDVKEKLKKIAQLQLDYRKGKIQNCKSIWKCPHIVMATMWYKATGGERNWEGQLDIDIDEKTYLPTQLQVAQVAKTLWPAFSKDLAILVDGKPKYNKRIVGPNFTEAWNKICEKSVEREAAPDTVRAKAYSKDELKADEEKWLSALATLLCRSHRREPDVDPAVITVLDKNAFYAEILAERAPDEWATAVVLAKNLEKEIVANEAEVNAQPKGGATPPPEKPTEKEPAAKIVRRPASPKAKSAKRAAARK